MKKKKKKENRPIDRRQNSGDDLLFEESNVFRQLFSIVPCSHTVVRGECSFREVSTTVVVHKESITHTHRDTHVRTRTCHGKVDFHGGNFASPCLLRLAQLVRTVKDIEGRRKIARNRLFDESMEISASSRNISLSSSYIYVSSRISIWNGRGIFAVILFSLFLSFFFFLAMFLVF